MPTFGSLDIFLLADDDLVWSVGCTYADFVAFLDDPVTWLDVVTAEAKQRGLLGQTESLVLADHYSVQVRPAFATEAETVQRELAPFAGLTLVERLDKLNDEEKAAFQADIDAPTFLIYGISGTSYVSIEPNIEAVIALFILHDKWDNFWKSWRGNLATTGSTVILPVPRYAYTHIEITEKEDAVEHAEKIAAFLAGASRSVWHLNSLLQVKPHDYRYAVGTDENHPLRLNPPAYAPVTTASMTTVAFNYIGSKGEALIACEVPHGIVDENGKIILMSSTAKFYPA